MTEPSNTRLFRFSDVNTGIFYFVNFHFHFVPRLHFPWSFDDVAADVALNETVRIFINCSRKHHRLVIFWTNELAFASCFIRTHYIIELSRRSLVIERADLRSGAVFDRATAISSREVGVSTIVGTNVYAISFALI